MLTPTEIEEPATSASMPAPPSAAPSAPEWHSLRLFGAGRHTGGLLAGGETRAGR